MTWHLILNCSDRPIHRSLSLPNEAGVPLFTSNQISHSLLFYSKCWIFFCCWGYHWCFDIDSFNDVCWFWISTTHSSLKKKRQSLTTMFFSPVKFEVLQLTIQIFHLICVGAKETWKLQSYSFCLRSEITNVAHWFLVSSHWCGVAQYVASSVP